MCIVSFVADQWMNPSSPNHIPWTLTSPSPQTAYQMLEVLAKLEELDKRLNAIDCKLKKKEKTALKNKLRRRANKK